MVTDDQTTLAEILSAEGWSTAAAVGSFPLTSQFGLDQGFGLYDETLAVEYFDHLGRRTRPRSGVFFDERRAEQVNEALVPWLEAHHDEPFFAWVHYFDPHQPHRPPPPYDQLYADDLYDGEIAYADECFGALRRELERHGVWDRTIVVFAADHGEGLGEHREQTHSFLNYNSTLHVPLIVRMPGRGRGTVISDRVSLADVAPTVLDLLGLTIPDSVQGRSLASAVVEGEPVAPASLYSETLSPRLSNGWGELRTLFDGDLKYIHGPRPELFNLGIDPQELDNLAESEPETAAAMRQRLGEFISTHARSTADAAVEVDEHTREQLAALGYVPSAAETPVVGEEMLRDDGTPPQDRVADIADGSELRQLLQRGQYEQARKVAQVLVDRDPDQSDLSGTTGDGGTVWRPGRRRRSDHRSPHQGQPRRRRRREDDARAGDGALFSRRTG